MANAKKGLNVKGPGITVEVDPLAHALLLNMLNNIAYMLEKKVAPEKVAQQIRDFIARAES
jgi:hypothetical protein